MHWRTGVFSAALVCLLPMVHAQAQNAANNLDALVQSALANNRELLATRLRLAEAEGLLRQAGVRPNPTLEIEGGTGRPLRTTGEEEYSAGYFHPIELGGKREKRRRVAEVSVDLAKAEFDERARQLTSEVKLRAIEALVKTEKSRTLERLANVNDQAYRLTAARVSEGDLPSLDAKLLLVEKTRNEAQRAALSGQLESDLIELKRFIGIGPDDQLTLGDTFPTTIQQPTLEALQNLALRQRPDFRLSQLLENQGHAEVTLADSQSKPDVTLSARYTHRNSQFDQFGLSAAGARVPLRDSDNVVTFGASVPLFNGKRNQGNVEAATARVSAAMLRERHLSATIPLEVAAAYKRWQTTKKTISIYDKGIIEQSAKNLEVIRQAYELGQLRLLDVLNEQRRLTEIELFYIDAKADFARAVIDLERTIGGTLP